MLNGRHGGNDLGLDIDLDLSASLNPLGMPERVRQAAANAVGASESYPDPLCRSLRERLAAYAGVSVDRIVCGNGADDLIYRAAAALRPRRALVCVPAFGEYKKALGENGCHVEEYPLSEENDFLLTEDMLPHIKGQDMVFVCSPNNPTGRAIPPRLLGELVRRCGREGAYLLCDESFMGFTGRERELSAVRLIGGKTIVLGSFTKLYAMAGLRLGYALCGSRQLCERITGTGQYWSVSAPAQAAGIAALDEEEYVRETVELIRTERQYLSESLCKMGFTVFPSEANYLLFKAPVELGELLLKEKILLRSCGDYSGLDSAFFRIAVGRHSDNMRFIETVRRVMNG